MSLYDQVENQSRSNQSTPEEWLPPYGITTEISNGKVRRLFVDTAFVFVLEKIFVKHRLCVIANEYICNNRLKILEHADSHAHKEYNTFVRFGCISSMWL